MQIDSAQADRHADLPRRDAGSDASEPWKVPNPFSTRFTRPDLVTYLPNSHREWAAWISRLSELGYRAAIVGPHGAGKTCLWSTLITHLETNSGLQVLRFSLPRTHAWKDLKLALQKHRSGALDTVCVLGVDGIEQLMGWQRAWLIRQTRRQSMGLFVTSHRNVLSCLGSLPTLCQLQPGLNSLIQSLRAIRDRWTEGNRRLDTNNRRTAELVSTTAQAKFDLLTEAESLRNLGTGHHWDLREILFSLYDRWEQTP